MKTDETVQVVLLNQEGLVLGVSRKTDHNDMGLPGGSLEDYDNDIESGAIRETKEETGLEISNLRLIYSRLKGGRMGYTYLADYSGEIDYDMEKEPHLVKWTNFQDLINGSFGEWNQAVYDKLLEMGITVKL